MGRTYGYGNIYETGKFRGKRALLSLTTGGPEEAYRKRGFNGDISGIRRPIQLGILHFVGFDVLAPHIHFGPVRSNDARRLHSIAHEVPSEVGEY